MNYHGNLSRIAPSYFSLAPECGVTMRGNLDTMRLGLSAVILTLRRKNFNLKKKSTNDFLVVIVAS